MKVRALRMGWFKKSRVKPGQIFEIANEKQFSKSWMEKVEGEAKVDEKPEQPKKKSEKAVLADSEVI